MQADYVIVGGGVVGLSVAYGLLQSGCSVTVLDQGDGAFRASRGNFGLVWVQGKGLLQPRYARWSQQSAGLWAEFAGELQQLTGIDLALQQRGGYSFYLDEQSLQQRADEYTHLRHQLTDYPFEVLGHNALRKEEPNIGPRVAGAILHHSDGHVNSLRLLRALATAVRLMGANVMTNTNVQGINPNPADFSVNYTQHGSEKTASIAAAKVLLCAGLGAINLAPALGFAAPIRPQRGQVLITERIVPLINRPSDVIRQVDEGGVQIGASSEEVGLDDSETIEISATLASDAITLFPALAKVNLLRSWAALRIMSPDGLPIYQQSKLHPGAYFITCHSGITLAAVHAKALPKWLLAHSDAPDLAVFSEERFNV